MYSFVIPCYNSSESIRHVVELTMEEMEKMNRREFEFVLVNDYSSSTKTMPVLKKLAEEYPCVTVLNLAKNAGQHNAIMAGLNYAKGDILIGMDDDMQTHPSQLPYLFEELEKGYDIDIRFQLNSLCLSESGGFVQQPCQMLGVWLLQEHLSHLFDHIMPFDTAIVGRTHGVQAHADRREIVQHRSHGGLQQTRDASRHKGGI